jgi:hypothetical protein
MVVKFVSVRENVIAIQCVGEGSNKPSFPQSERGGGYVFENEQESQEGKTKLVCKSRTHIEWADKKRPVKEKNALQK